MTGVEGNSEIKIWTCETWSCIQTIKYEPFDDSPSSSFKLKVAVDITANYILVSDMQRKVGVLFVRPTLSYRFMFFCNSVFDFLS